MKKFAAIFVLLCCLPGCYGTDEEEAKRELIRDQVRIVQTEVRGLERGHQAMGQQLASLQASLDAFNAELNRVDARLVAAKGSNKYLFELHTVGFGPSAGRWVLENPAWPTNILLLFALVVVLCWVLYRMRLASSEAAAMAEVEQVLSRLNQPAGGHPPASAVPDLPVAAQPATTAVKPPAVVPVVPPSPAPDAKSEPARPATPAAKPAVKKADKDKPAAKRAAKRKPVRPQAKKCKVEGCPNKHRSKGYCNKHYQQWRRSGNPEEEKEQ